MAQRENNNGRTSRTAGRQRRKRSFMQNSDGLLAERRLGEIEEHIPIGAIDRMWRLADVITQRAAEALVVFRAGLGRYAVAGEKLVNARRRLQHVELPRRIGPWIFLAAGEEHRPWAAEGDQAILIKGQLLFMAAELLESRIEPVRKALVDSADGLGLWIMLPAGSRSAAAGLMRNYDRDPFVRGAGQQ